MHQNADYQGIFEYFVAASEFRLKKKHTQKHKQNQIKTSSLSFVYLKSSYQDITAFCCILDQTFF